MQALKLVMINNKMEEIATLSVGMVLNYHTAWNYVFLQPLQA